MKIIFFPDGTEIAYSKYDALTGASVFFSKKGEEKEVSDTMAQKIIADFPRMFGRTLEDIQKVRGEKVIVIEKVKEISPEEAKHPMTVAFKKLSTQLKATEGKEPEKKPPMKKLIRKTKGR